MTINNRPVEPITEPIININQVRSTPRYSHRGGTTGPVPERYTSMNGQISTLDQRVSLGLSIIEGVENSEHYELIEDIPELED